MDGFDVECAALDAAATRLARLATSGTTTTGTTGGSFGQPDLDGAFAQFTGRWQAGVSALTTDLTSMSQALTMSARGYGRAEESIARSLAVATLA